MPGFEGIKISNLKAECKFNFQQQRTGSLPPGHPAQPLSNYENCFHEKSGIKIQNKKPVVNSCDQLFSHMPFLSDLTVQPIPLSLCLDRAL